MSPTRTLVRLAQQRFPMPVEAIQYYFVQHLSVSFILVQVDGCSFITAWNFKWFHVMSSTNMYHVHTCNMLVLLPSRHVGSCRVLHKSKLQLTQFHAIRVVSC